MDAGEETQKDQNSSFKEWGKKMDGTDITATLGNLDKRLSKIETSIASLEKMLKSIPGVVATVADAADEFIGQNQGINSPTPEARLSALGSLGQKVSEPETAARLERLLDHLDLVESSLHQATQLPGVLATGADALDELAMEANRRGILLDERAKISLGLLEQLTRPEIAAGLSMLVDKINILEDGAKMATALPGVMATTADMVDEIIGNLAAEGVDVEKRAKESLLLLKRLTDPDVMNALPPLLDQLGTISDLSKHLNDIPKGVAAIADVADDYIGKWQSQGLDIDSLLKGILTLSSMASTCFNSPNFEYHLERGFLAPDTIATVSAMGESLAKAQGEERKDAGPMSALMALRDPEIRRVLDFGLSFARHFGRALRGKKLLPDHF